MRELEEILVMKNDNDPRLDVDFRDLSPAFKDELRKKYLALATEDRNGRGTIVFLLGREINSAADLTFFANVLSESPCLSLNDCARRPSPEGVDEHAAMAGGVTLVYPQLVAIKSFERVLEVKSASGAPRGSLRSEILDALKAARGSEQPRVSQAAREALARFSSP